MNSPKYFFPACIGFVDDGKSLAICRREGLCGGIAYRKGVNQPYTGTTKDFKSKRGILSGWCIVKAERTAKYTTPRSALAMFTMAFVEVVRRLWDSKF